LDHGPIKRQRGALMIAAAGVLAIIALTLLAVFAMRQQQSALGVTQAPAIALARLDAALAVFVARHRRLPCPARGTIASGALNAGVESINTGSGQCVPANQADGVVPWVTLGLSEHDGLDPWSSRISYRVQPSLASNLLTLMDMSWCDPAGTPTNSGAAAMACTASCSGAACTNPLNYLYAKGLPVRDGAGAWLNQPAPAWNGTPPPPLATGAAYVLVVHGINGARAYNANGVLQAAAVPVSTSEQGNYNGQPLTGASVFTDTARLATPGAQYFDDQLSHPTLATVLAAAALGARTPH
jgi:hypothetical protein